MVELGEQPMGGPDWPRLATPAVFLTACRNGTGGHRVEVLADRIVTRDPRGGMSQLRFDEIESARAFETNSSPPAYGVHVVRRDNDHDVRYVFDAAATRRVFWRAVGRRIRPRAA